MEPTTQFKQKQSGTKTAFEFRPTALRYSVEDAGGQGTFSVPYEEIPSEAGELTERNAWFRNVAYLWMLIGVVSIVLHVSEHGELGGGFWLLIGGITYAVYRFKTVTYTVYDTRYGRVFVIRDKHHDRIVAELGERRAGALRSRFATVDAGNEPEDEVRKFEWLREEGAISDAEFEDYVRQIRLGLGTSGGNAWLN